MSTVQDEQTQDYIRLLRGENGVLRKQILDLQSEKARTRSPKLPTYDDVDHVDFLQKQCRELRKERDALLLEVAGLKNAFCNDSAHADAVKMVTTLSKQLHDALNFEDEEKQLLRDRVLELEQAHRQHILGTEDNPPVNESPWTVVQSSPRSKVFDLTEFVRELQMQEVIVPAEYEGPFSDVETLQMPKGITALMPRGSLRFSYSELIWKLAGAELFVGLVPMRVSKPINGGRNSRWEDHPVLKDLGVKAAGQRREIFFLHDHVWHYYGEYQCVGSVSLTTKQVDTLGYKKMIPYAVSRTLLNSNGATPVTENRIKAQYARGELKIQCFAFKRVAFNRPLNQLLQERGVWTTA